MALFDEPGLGRKQCPKCQKYMGVRTLTCENCEHSFGVGVRDGENIVSRVHQGIPTVAGVMRVCVPAGECPARLTGTDTETVLTWAKRVCDHFAAQRQSLEVSGLVYFVRQFFDYHTEAYRLVRQTLRSYIPSTESSQGE